MPAPKGAPAGAIGSKPGGGYIVSPEQANKDIVKGIVEASGQGQSTHAEGIATGTIRYPGRSGGGGGGGSSSSSSQPEQVSVATQQAQQTKAKLDAERKQEEQQKTREILAQSEKQLQAENLTERRKFQKGEISREALSESLSANRLAYLQERANQGVPYSDKNIEITKGKIVDKKTGQVYDTTPQKAAQPKIDYTQFQSRPERVLQASTDKAPSKVTRFVREKYYGLIKPSTIQVLEQPNVYAAQVGESYRTNLPRLGITTPGRAKVVGAVAEFATVSPLYATQAGYVFGAYESGKAIKQSFNPNNSPLQRGIYGAIGAVGVGLIGSGVKSALLSTQRVVRPQTVKVYAADNGVTLIRRGKPNEFQTTTEQSVYRNLLTDSGEGTAAQVIITRTTPRDVVKQPVGAGKLFFSEGKPTPITPRVERAGNPSKAPYIFNEAGQLVSSGVTVTQRQGANQKKFSMLVATGKNLQDNVAAQLSPAQRKAFLGSRGVVVIPETAQVGAGQSTLIKAFRTSSKQEPYTLYGYKPGRRTTRAESVGTANKVYENPFVEFYSTRSNVKSTTFPTKPTTKGVSSIFGEAKVIKEPIDIRSKGADFIGGKREPSVTLYQGTTKASAEIIRRKGFNSDTISLTPNKGFAEGFANRKVLQNVLKGGKSEPIDIIEVKLPKSEYEKYKAATKSKFYEEVVVDRNANIKIVKPRLNNQERISLIQSQTAGIAKTFPTVRPRIVSPSLDEIPKMVGGRGLVKSAFAGQGTYEKTYGAVRVQGKTSQVLDTTQIQSPELKDIQLDFTIPRQTPETRPREDVFEVVKPRQDEVQLPKERQRENLVNRPTQTQGQFPKNPKLFEPIPQNRSSDNGGSKGIKLSLLGKVKKAYEVITYKNGKEVVLAKGLPVGRAQRLGTQNVLSSLRASFKLREKGYTSQEDINFKVPGNLFTRGKNDANRFVQIKNKRLSSRSETNEIIKIPKKTKSTRSKQFKWFS